MKTNKDTLKNKNTQKYWLLNNCIVEISSVSLKNFEGISFPHNRLNSSDSSSSFNNSSSNTSTNSTNDSSKTDQESFDETIDENDTQESRARTSTTSNNKRRYKSEIDSKPFVNKKEHKKSSRHSKDDISLTSSNESSNYSFFKKIFGEYFLINKFI